MDALKLRTEGWCRGAKVRDHMQLARLVAAISVALTLLGAAGVAAASDEAVRQGAGSQKVREFPVWRLLPTDDYATLSDRLIEGRRWALYLFKGSSPRQACLQAFILHWFYRVTILYKLCIAVFR